MIKIIKFSGRPTSSRKKNRTHQGYVLVEKDGETRTIELPVAAGSSSSAASAARKWRNIEGNMARLEKAFDEGLHSVPSKKVAVAPDVYPGD